MVLQSADDFLTKSVAQEEARDISGALGFCQQSVSKCINVMLFLTTCWNLELGSCFLLPL